MQATITGIKTGSSTETSKLLTKILNTFYTSGIDRVKTYGKTSSGNIVGEFIADGTSFQYVLNMKTNTVSYEPVGNKTASKADSLLAEQENANRFKTIYSVREAFEVSDASEIEQKLDSWFFRADASTKAKVGVKTAANKSGKTLTCTPGKTYPCGAVCRAFGSDCRQKMSPEVQAMVEQFAAKIKTPTAATVALTVKPTATTTTPLTGAIPGKITAQQLADEIAAAKALQPDTDKKPPNSSKLLSKIIRTKQIDAPTEEFDEKDLRAAAETFLELGGFVEPPVVKRTGTELNQKYEVISGQFQIAAGIVARAIDPIRGETLNAIVIEEENEEAIRKQIKAQRNANAAQNTSSTKSMTYKQFESKFESEYRQETKRQELRGVVAIRTKEMKPLFTKKHNISDNDFDDLFDKLKKSGKLFTVIENGNELMQWAD